LHRSGIRHVPLTARVKCYISFASGRGQTNVFVTAHESVVGPSATSLGEPGMSAFAGEAVVPQASAEVRV
jgi:hypothetical protein